MECPVNENSYFFKMFPTNITISFQKFKLRDHTECEE